MRVYKVDDFQHPQDSKFANDILSSKTAEKVLEKFHETNLEEAYTYLYQSSCPQLTAQTSPKLFELLAKACKMFGLEKIPSVYVTRDYREIVAVRGINEPFLVFSSEYLRKITDDETLFGILAGQVAAIRCNHHTILCITWGIDFAAGFIPYGSWATDPMINNWKRCRYFTYDRAFSLATKSRSLSLRQVLINVLLPDILNRMQNGTSQDAFINQVEDFLETMNNNKTQALIKKALSMYSYKIWLPERYSEINKFFDEWSLDNANQSL
ncbi:MAG: hypothetical protein IJK81_04355 [Selenomonadaceae bacterium]|nr:hypothetical protein [Selenomonadaceae bacterium]